MQKIDTQPILRDQILELIATDVNANSREDIGREGFTYWMILVLAAVKLGCNFDYDKFKTWQNSTVPATDDGHRRLGQQNIISLCTPSAHSLRRPIAA